MGYTFRGFILKAQIHHHQITVICHGPKAASVFSVKDGVIDVGPELFEYVEYSV